MADVSSLGYLMPLLAFLLVFIVSYALLAKTKILAVSNFWHIFLSLVIAIMFVVSPSASQFTMISTPWIAVFLIALFFIVMMLTFLHGNLDEVVKSPAISIVLIVVLLIIFVISAVNVFGPLITSYLPGGSEAALTPQQAQAKHFFVNPAVIGAIILLIIAAVASWVLTK